MNARHVSRRRAIGVFAATAAVLLHGCGAFRGKKEESMSSQLEYKVKGITKVVDKFGRLSWGKNNLIAFDSAGEDGLYDVWIMNPDGSDRICLTNNPEQIPQGHNGNPDWHPSGDYIVFQSERAHHPGGHIGASPGAGYFCDLWVMTPDGRSFWQLNEIDVDKVQASLHPHFSSDGKKITWSERLVHHPPAMDDLGEWGIRLADFVVDPEPHLENVELYQPGESHSWYETHGFLADNATLLFSANPNKGQSVAGQDVCTYNPHTGEFRNLTNTPRDWEEHAHLSPDGRKISFMGNTGLNNGWTKFTNFMDWLKTELFLMNPDGTDLQQVTRFNEPGFPESTGSRTVFADHDWSPDGTRIGALVDITRSGGFEEWFYIVEFE